MNNKEREQRIKEIMHDHGVLRGMAQELLAIELRESDGDVIALDEDGHQVPSEPGIPIDQR